MINSFSRLFTFALLVLFSNLLFAINFLESTDTTTSGELTYTERVDKLGQLSDAVVEKITFGKSTGHYAYGVLFDASQIPQPYRHELGSRHILQANFSTLPGLAKGRVLQFASLMAMTPDFTGRLIFPVGLNSNLNTPSSSLSAFMMFNSPTLQSEKSAQEKLQARSFGYSGTLEVTPKPSPQQVVVDAANGPVRFLRRNYQMKVDVILKSPFSELKNELKGELEFPVYSAKEKLAEQLLSELATKSLADSVTQTRSLSNSKE